MPLCIIIGKLAPAINKSCAALILIEWPLMCLANDSPLLDLVAIDLYIY